MLKSYICGHQWIEAELFDWDSELGKFAFVGLDHVRVRFSYFLKLGLDFSNSIVLEVFDFFEGGPDHAEGLGINVGHREDLVGLCIFCFQGILYGL